MEADIYGKWTWKANQSCSGVLQQGGDERAFERLVERHAAMVRGVAQRCTRDAALSDEVTQSVFSLLARRASAVPSGHLGGWLHNTAFLTARNASRKAWRYRKALADLSHHKATMNHAESAPNVSEGSPWENVREHLDEAISYLPAKARHAVILRFFEGKSIRDIAAATGKSEAASRKQISRSLETLCRLLKRRGFITTGPALSAMLSSQSLFAPPASAAALAAAALRTALSPASTATDTLLTKAITLMTVTHTAKTAVVAVIIGSIPAALLWKENAALKKEARDHFRTGTAGPVIAASTPVGTKASAQNGGLAQDGPPWSKSETTLTLSAKVINALVLRKGFEEKTLQRMGLNADQIEKVMRAKTQVETAFAELESRHSKEVTDARGDYVEISPFPEDRQKWMADLNQSLRAFIPDDRAAVITEMIAPMNNDEDVGRHRREVFVTGSPDQPNAMRIQEQTFDDQGRLMDTDFLAIGTEVPARWMHLLKLSEK